MTIPIQAITPSSTPIETRPSQAEKRTYYCTFATMNVRTSLGRMVQDATNSTRLAHIGEKFAQFTPCHPEFGKYSTTDPEEHEFFEREIAAGNPDFLNQEQYEARTVDPRTIIAQREAQIAELQAELQRRQLGDRREEILSQVAPVKGRGKGE